MKSFRYAAFACLAAIAMIAGGCQTPGSNTSAAGWGQIATGVGQVVGQTPVDKQVAKAGAELDKYCGFFQTAAAAGSIFAPAKQQAVAQQAQAGINALCYDPPKDVAGALLAAARIYSAIQATKEVVPPAPKI